MGAITTLNPGKKTAKMETTVRARIDPVLKAKAEKILEKVGLSPSEAVRLFLQQVTLHKGLPFEVRIPNAETEKALRSAKSGVGTLYADEKELMAKIRRRG